MNASEIAKEVRFAAVRSRGPGGQNVNKVASAAHLTWDFANSKGLNESEKTQVRVKLANIVNRQGFIHLRSDEFRDLERNKARGFEKLIAALKRALHRPKPRRATKPTASSRRRRLEGKSRRGELKATRKKIDY